MQPDVNSHTCFCRFEDYVGQLEAATAIAGLSVEKGRTVGIKDRKDIAAVQEVCLHLLALVVQLGAVWSKITIVAVWHGYAWCPSVFCISRLNLVCCQGQVCLGFDKACRIHKLNACSLEGASAFAEASSVQEREAHLADLMKAKLQKFVDGDKEGFKQQIQNEADRIAAVPFGVPMLEVIG